MEHECNLAEIFCPKCNSLKITLYVDGLEYGYRCLDCSHEWGSIRTKKI